MCKVKLPKVPKATKIPGPAKAGLEAPELAISDEVVDEEAEAGRLGLDRLRIQRSPVTAALKRASVGVQTGA